MVNDRGLLSPFIIHWPDGIGIKPRECASLISSIDVAPTILELSSVASSREYIKVAKQMSTILSDWMEGTGDNVPDDLTKDWYERVPGYVKKPFINIRGEPADGRAYGEDDKNVSERGYRGWYGIESSGREAIMTGKTLLKKL
ncbi:MAG: hypothetical protein WAW07_02365 [Bacteroidales bacterium]